MEFKFPLQVISPFRSKGCTFKWALPCPPVTGYHNLLFQYMPEYRKMKTVTSLDQKLNPAHLAYKAGMLTILP
jgi:hypothetical protein